VATRQSPAPRPADERFATNAVVNANGSDDRLHSGRLTVVDETTELDEEQRGRAGAAAFGAPPIEAALGGGWRYYPGQEGAICSSGQRSQIGSNRSPATRLEFRKSASAAQMGRRLRL
jgi:hypothetical protein